MAILLVLIFDDTCPNFLGFLDYTNYDFWTIMIRTIRITQKIKGAVTSEYQKEKG